VAAVKERLARWFAGLRERRPSVDHIVKTFSHYAAVNGNGQAGAVTFFGFLSFFPILALAFFVVGYVSTVYPDLRREVVQALEEVLPGVVGADDGEIPLSTFEEYAGTVGLVGLVGVLYSGLGWLSGMRQALAVMFVKPLQDRPNVVVGKARDLLALGLIGLVLLVSISLSGAVSWFSGLILGWLRLDGSWLAAVVLWSVAHGLAIAATTVLFVSIFRLLAQPDVTGRALWQGAVAGALGFEVLKAAAGFLIAQTKDQPAFQAFGVALILVVWINYFSRLVMLSAAWAYTAPVAEQVRELARRPLVEAEDAEQVAPAPATVVAEDPGGAPLQRAWGQRRDLQRLPALGAVVAAGVAALTWWTRRRSL
jgi:membrane protein